jgi:hypothetical protein
MLRRLGLASRGAAKDDEFLTCLFRFLLASQVGYERFFFDWRGGLASTARAAASPESARYAGAEFEALRAAMAPYAPASDARLWHPYFRGGTPCTLLIEQTECIWQAIAATDDWSLFEAKLKAIGEMADAYGVCWGRTPSEEKRQTAPRRRDRIRSARRRSRGHGATDLTGNAV